MTDETINENEQAQLRRIVAFQKVVLGIFLKWKWLLLLLFVLLGTAFHDFPKTLPCHPLSVIINEKSIFIFVVLDHHVA